MNIFCSYDKVKRKRISADGGQIYIKQIKDIIKVKFLFSLQFITFKYVSSQLDLGVPPEDDWFKLTICVTNMSSFHNLCLVIEVIKMYLSPININISKIIS